MNLGPGEGVEQVGWDRLRGYGFEAGLWCRVIEHQSKPGNPAMGGLVKMSHMLLQSISNNY